MTSKIPEAARDLEAYFLRRMLAEAKTASSGVFGSGFQGETFKDMLDEAIADKMADAGGVGLAESIAHELDPGFGGAETAAAIVPLRKSYSAYRAVGPSLEETPVGGIQTSGFGLRRDPIDGGHRAHNGVDIAAELGTPVRSAGAGVVVRAEATEGYGNLVVVDHGGGLQTRYAHLAELGVRAGDRLNAGETVGSVGETGRATGPHLHFEVLVDGRPIDPHTSGLKLPR